MLQLLLIFCVTLLTCNSHILMGYGLPAVGLGTSNFLDGGPLRPVPGLYWQQNSRYYHADIFRDICGNTLNKDHAVDLNIVTTSTQLAYQFRPGLLPRSQFGLAASLPFVFYNHINCNSLGIRSSGSGFGDFAAGFYFQFDPIMEGDRPIFVHRFEFDAIFPTGKNESPQKNLNPGSNLFYIDPYWSFTLYFNPEFALSMRLNYLWCGENKKTGLQPGQAIHGNYTLEKQVMSNVWIGINGYYLQQLTDNKLCDVKIPCSKEKVFSTGIGALYLATPQDVFFFNLFFECFAKNRAQGFSFFFRYLGHF